MFKVLALIAPRCQLSLNCWKISQRHFLSLLSQRCSEVHLLQHTDPSSCHQLLTGMKPHQRARTVSDFSLKPGGVRSSTASVFMYDTSLQPSPDSVLPQERLDWLYGLRVAEESGTQAQRSQEGLEWNVTVFLLRLGLFKQRTACNYPTHQVWFKGELFA